MKVIVIILLLTVSGCSNSSQNPKRNDSITAAVDSTKTTKDTLSKIEINDSTIEIRFPKDSKWVTVSGKMKGINHPVTVYISVKQGKTLTATILPEDSAANIRINQIFTPGGKAAGPFGREVKRQLHEQGTYKLIIGENLMQGDEWKGEFKLTVKVE